MTAYRKLIAAVLGSLASWLLIAPDGGVDAKEWGALGAAVLGVIAVWLVPNEPAPSVDGDRGRADVVTILVVIALLLAILWLLGYRVHVG